jgi:YVTN family beta-propeller protein
MLDGTSRGSTLSRRGITHSTLLLAVVAIAVVMLLPSAFGQSIAATSASVVGLANASTSTAHVTGATVAQNLSSLTLPSPGALNVFGMATGGQSKTTEFAYGNVVTATDKKGYVSAAIGVTQQDSNSYTTKDHYYSIGGVGVSGFKFYGEQTKVLIPPVQPTSTVTEKLVMPESALMVVIALSGGQTSIVLTGIPGLGIVANGTGGTWSGILIGQAQLKAGTYTVKETTTNHDAGGTNRADMLGLFAFSNTKKGFIDKGIIRVVATIPVGMNPYAAVYDKAKGEVFVSNIGSNNVTVINDTSNRVLANIPVGVEPYQMAYDPAAGEIFVTNSGSSNVSVIDDTTNSVVANINVDYLPQGIAYDSGRGEVFVGDNSNVNVISTSTDKVVATLAVGDRIVGLAYDSAQGEIFVSNNYGFNVNVINDTSDSVVATIGIGYYPQWIVYDRANSEIFVANMYSNSVSVINVTTNTVVATVSVVSDPIGVAYDRGAGEVFVTGFDSEQLSVISVATNTVVTTFSAGTTTFFAPNGVVYDSGKGELFVEFSPLNTVSVISDGTS